MAWTVPISEMQSCEMGTEADWDSEFLLQEQVCSMCENENQMEELIVAKTLMCSLAHLFLHTGYTTKLYFLASFATRYG